MHGIRHLRDHFHGVVRVLGITAIAATGLLLCAGCMGGRSAERPMTFYVLEYEAPAASETPLYGDAVTVLRFSAAELYNGTAMLYRNGPYRRTAYHYYRWKVTPAAMISNLLYRDLSQSGLFAAVRTDLSYEKSRYLLEGHVTEFLETDEGETRSALLGVTITVSDSSKKDAARSICLQKDYRIAVLLDEETPEGLVRAMSRAAETLSKELRQDIRAALSD